MVGRGRLLPYMSFGRSQPSRVPLGLLHQRTSFLIQHNLRVYRYLCLLGVNKQEETKYKNINKPQKAKAKFFYSFKTSNSISPTIDHFKHAYNALVLYNITTCQTTGKMFPRTCDIIYIAPGPLCALKAIDCQTCIEQGHGEEKWKGMR